MNKSFKQQESNSVLGSDGAGEVEGTVVLKATGESTGQKSHKRTWWTLTNVWLLRKEAARRPWASSSSVCRP
jgi:hypothetical protein